MAVDALLKVEGPEVKGESRIEGHTNEIDILAWSWGATQSGTFHTGGGGGAGKVNVQDLTVSKLVDASTVPFFEYCCTGDHFDKMILTVRKAGSKPLDYIVITMEKVMVVSVQPGSAAKADDGKGDELVSEEVTFNFAKVSIDYKVQDDKGKEKEKKTLKWDVEKNVKV